MVQYLHFRILEFPLIWLGESTPIGYDLGYQAFHQKLTYVLKKKKRRRIGFRFFLKKMKPMETTIVDGFK